MDRIEAIQRIRLRLAKGQSSIGSWMQIPHGSVAEIMGQAGYEWIAVDMEHGAVSVHQLPSLFRALELGGVLPLVRLAQGQLTECKQALDAGAGGVIVPMVENADQLEAVRKACCWPPSGTRGVGFSRANLFGKHFDRYREEAQKPLLVAMIEHVSAIDNLDSILTVPGLDVIMVGPYDLSASMGLTGEFERKEFQEVMRRILDGCRDRGVPVGTHVVFPDPEEFRRRTEEGYLWIAYSIDSVFLISSSEKPDAPL